MRTLLALGAATALTLLAPAAAAGPGAPGSAVAPGSSGAAKARAKVLFERGIEAYRTHHYNDAIHAFLQAHRIYPSPVLSFNVARAYEKLDDHAGALRFYRAYLRRAPAASDRARVEKRISELETLLHRKGIQQVTVLSTPDGATVIIDGQPVGVTPWTGEIDPGHHQLRLRREGYRETQRDFELPDLRAIDVSATLDPAPLPAAVAAGAPSVRAVRAVRTSPAPRSAAPGDERSHRGVRLPTWIALGASAAMLGGAAVFEALRRSSMSSVQNEPTQIARGAAYDQMRTRQTTARVLAGTGVVVLLVGGTLLYLDLSRDGSEKSTHLALGCAASGCNATLGGRW